MTISLTIQRDSGSDIAVNAIGYWREGTLTVITDTRVDGTRFRITETTYGEEEVKTLTALDVAAELMEDLHRHYTELKERAAEREATEGEDGESDEPATNTED